MCCRDNDARRFARLRKHYCSRRYGEKPRYFIKRLTVYNSVRHVTPRASAVREQESLANTKVNAREQCMYEGPYSEELDVEKYWSIFIRLAVVASQICKIPRNFPKIRTYSSSRSSKVIDLVANRMLIIATSY